MSKLYDKYLKLKKENKETCYLFKSGLFLIFIDEDAVAMSSKLGLKCTKLNDSILKCGFPTNSMEKYMKKLNDLSIEITIIDNDELLDLDEKYLENLKINHFVNKLKELDMDKVTPMESLKFLHEFSEVLRDE